MACWRGAGALCLAWSTLENDPGMRLPLVFVMAISAKHRMRVSRISTGKTSAHQSPFEQPRWMEKGQTKGQRGSRQVTLAEGELGAKGTADGRSPRKPFPQDRRQQLPELQ